MAPTHGAESIAPNANPVLAQRTWEHHPFNLWEHLLVFRVLPHFNNYDGLHVAGDWTQSVGQEAAVRSGVAVPYVGGVSTPVRLRRRTRCSWRASTSRHRS